MKTEAYISGAICGHTWLSETLAGIPFRADIKGPFGINRSSEPVSFQDTLQSAIKQKGGDFQDPAFSEDTEIVIIRKYLNKSGPGYIVHSKIISVADHWPELIHGNMDVSDFFDD